MITSFLRQSSGNVGPPKFCGKGYIRDVVHQFEEKSGSASNPITLNPTSSNEPKPTLIHSDPSNDLAILFDTTLSDIHSPSSTDQSLRMAIEDYDENVDMDSELFNAEFEKRISGDQN